MPNLETTPQTQSAQLVLHQKSLWSNADTRKLEASRAIANQDEPTLKALLEFYVRRKGSKKEAVSAKTLKRYKYGLQLFLDWAWQPNNTINLLQITDEDLETFMAWLSVPEPPDVSDPNTATTSIVSSRRYYSRSSIDTALVALKWLFRALNWCNAIKTDPSLDIKAPQVTSNPKRPVMRQADLERFKTLKPHPNSNIATRDAAILELGISAMLRANEIVGLDCADINLATATLSVRRGKGNKDRKVPLMLEPLAKLRAWLEVRPSFVTNRQTEALFLSFSDRNRGGRIGYDGIYNMLRVRFAQMEKPGEASFGGMHTLRRTGATKFHARNHDLALLQRVLGHENLQTTSIYVSLDDAVVRRAMERTAEGEEL